MTNITQLFILLANIPEPDFILIDKLIINAKMNNIIPVLIINKCDLTVDIYNKVLEEYKDSRLEIIKISTKTHENLDVLKEKLKNNITSLAGQSATGKTSLLNLICGLNNKTNEVSEKILRGKNTTTNAELIVLDENSFLLDTAGFSRLELNNFDPKELKNCYDEFNGYICDFKNCDHVLEGEKHCNVIKDIGDKINLNRYERYKQIYLECKDNWSKRYD